MTYQPPQNILAAILQSRKQSAYNDPGVPMPTAASPAAPMQQSKPPIDPAQILSGLLGGNQNSTPSALSQLAPQQAPTNTFSQLTNIGNPNQSNGQNIGALLAQLFGGG